MKLASQFPVPAPPERAFELFLNPDVMRTCIPGCEELVRVDDVTFRGRLVNVIAHVRFNAGFSVTMTAVEPPAKVVAVLKGEDHRLGSSIKMDAVLTLEPDGRGSIVGYEMELALWGKLGRLGEPIVRKRTAEVEKQFVRAFAEACGGAPVPATASAASSATGSSAAASPAASHRLAAVPSPAPADGAGAGNPAPRAHGRWARLVAWFRRRRRAGHQRAGAS